MRVSSVAAQAVHSFPSGASAISRAVSLPGGRAVQVPTATRTVSALLRFRAASAPPLGRRTVWLASVQLLPLLHVRARSLLAAVLRGSSCRDLCLSLPLDPVHIFSTFLIAQSHAACRKWTLRHSTRLCHRSALCRLAFSTCSRGQIMVPGERTAIIVEGCSCSLLVASVSSCHFLAALDRTRRRLNQH